ncbi:unnamed protein product [Soboliphyme baturini]|uniref:ANK_REP_REGION domain-containing protein n=1 Tax=Soboliphyme baturini TaxID=241478 RepID=A0A183JAU3_9BILA|nr:unnamed protein product [Soboliphyme baturini]
MKKCELQTSRLLHIVVWHKDYPKIYALTELMIKQKEGQEPPPFDLPNKLNEARTITPLFLAVQKRLEEVVAYLIACNANPNVKRNSFEEDTPLHFAASRGMTKIVKALCSTEKIDLNVKNKLGIGKGPASCVYELYIRDLCLPFICLCELTP